MERSIKPVELTARAIKDLNKVKDFNTELYEEVKAQEITDAIFKSLEVLENPEIDFTKIGGIDTNFLNLRRQYRKLILRHYRITYREGKTKIYIVRVFDTRQHPNKNK